MRSYAFVRRPRPAWVDISSPHPARLLLDLHSHALNHGMPASRRGGPLLAWAGRRGLPVVPAAAALRRLPAGPVPQLDLLLDDVARSWEELAACSTRLPATVPALSALAIQRASGRYVFVLADSRHPVLVLKPPPHEGQVDPEDSALSALGPTGIAPRRLPSVAGLSVQEGLPGRPLWVVAPGRPGWSRGYTAPYDALGAALVRISEQTAGRGGLDLDHYLGLVSGHVGPSATATVVDAARRDLRSLGAVSLQHRDLSAQNWLVDGPSFVGIVDWETGDPGGVPGHDALQAAVALLEHGVALRSVVPARGRAGLSAGLAGRTDLRVRPHVAPGVRERRDRDGSMGRPARDRVLRPATGATAQWRWTGDAVRGDPRGDAGCRHRCRSALSAPSRPGRSSARHACSASVAATSDSGRSPSTTVTFNAAHSST